MPTFSDEKDYLEAVKDMIDTNWIEYVETPRPALAIVNESDTEAFSRFDYSSVDYIIIKSVGPMTIKQRGNFRYYDRYITISLEIWTKVSRQRLLNLKKMVQMILNSQKHLLEGWQLIRMQSYEEAMEANLKIWKGTFNFQIEAHAICVETLE
jgi:hypothetical protein